MIAHRDNFAVAVEHRAGIVVPLSIDIGRKRGTLQRCAHLFRDRVIDVFESFEFDRLSFHRDF